MILNKFGNERAVVFINKVLKGSKDIVIQISVVKYTHSQSTKRRDFPKFDKKQLKPTNCGTLKEYKLF